MTDENFGAVVAELRKDMSEVKTVLKQLKDESDIRKKEWEAEDAAKSVPVERRRRSRVW